MRLMAPLAGCITSFEQHHQLELVMHDPVLQLDQFALQTDQLAEVEPAIHIPLGGIRPNRIPVEQGLHAVVVEFHLQLFVKAVEQLVMQMGVATDLAHKTVRTHPASLRAFNDCDDIRNSCRSM